MIVKFKCYCCGAEFDIEVQPMPKERTGGCDGFFEYEFTCLCGMEHEGVLGPKSR